MTLEKKIILVISSVGAAFLLLGISILYQLVSPSYLSMERDDITDDIERSISSISNEAEHVDSFCTDYATWDDTYDFIVEPNEKYINDNLQSESMARIKLHLAMVIDNSGKLVHAAFYTPDWKDTLPLDSLPPPAMMLAKVLPEGSPPSFLKGVARTAYGPMILAARPITQTKGDSPPRGVLIMGRFLDANLLKQLREQTRVEFDISPLSGEEPVLPSSPALRIDDAAKTITASSQMVDITGKPVLQVSTTKDRAIIREGMSTLKAAAVLFILGTLVLIAVWIYLLRMLITIPLVRLSAASKDIAHSKDFSQRLPSLSNDEIGLLSAHFNLLLSELCNVNTLLEHRIAERTAELAKSNKALMAEIAELDIMQQRMIEAKQQAESANSAKSVFLATMSHEIRTPLNGILGMLQLIGNSNLREDQKQYILHAIDSSRRLELLLSDILDLSRIEADELALREEEFELNNLKQSVMELFPMAAQKKGLGLEFSVDGRVPPRVMGDEVRLRQILFNLVGNAIKFTEKGGVRVEISPLRSDGLHVRLLFSVSDTGIGIPDALLDEIFEPFRQAEGDYARRFQGAGLGLTIVRKLVKLMGGGLSVDNAEEGGTTFYFCLPFKLQDPRQPRVVRTTHAIPSRWSKLRILIADDDSLSLLASKQMLEKSGHSVVTAPDGQEALRLLAMQEFDLILMDIQMPDMDGVETTKAIRDATRLGLKSSIPIIAMTAYAMAGDKEKFFEAGMDDYVAKPVVWEELAHAIERVLAKSPPKPSARDLSDPV